MEISKNNKKSNGFTLLELMIVVTVIGLLVGVALPAYSDYTARSRMTDVLFKAAACKTSISAAVSSFKAIPQTPPTAANGIDFGCECGVWNSYADGNNCSEFVSSIYVNRNAVVQVQLRDTISSGIDNGDRLRLIPRNSSGQTMTIARIRSGSKIHEWDCGVHSNASFAFDDRLLPSSCRS